MGGFKFSSSAREQGLFGREPYVFGQSPVEVPPMHGNEFFNLLVLCSIVQEARSRKVMCGL